KTRVRHASCDDFSARKPEVSMPNRWVSLFGAIAFISFLGGSSCKSEPDSTAAEQAKDDPLLIRIIGNHWHPLGPTITPNGQASNGTTNITGRINVVAVNPSNPLHDIWVGTAGGGVWRGSAFGSVSWDPMTDDLASLSIGAIALDGCNAARCSTVWIG